MKIPCERKARDVQEPMGWILTRIFGNPPSHGMARSWPRTLSSILSPDRVRVGLHVSEKPALIEEMVAIVAASDSSIPADRLLADVQEREGLMSTGVGDGLALPHARSRAVEETVAAFATLASPIDYEALDGKPVQVALLLAGPDSERGEHVRLLGRISRLMSREGVRERLVTASTVEDILDMIRSEEEAISS